MKRILLSILFICIGWAVEAATQQRVAVVEYVPSTKESDTNAARYKAVGQVSIVVTGAPTTVTDRKGKAELTFSTLSPGDKVIVRRIEKSGYEVMNPEILENWRISRNPEEEYTIVLIKQQTLLDLRHAYLKDMRQHYEKIYRSEKKKLEEKLDQIQTYIDHFARIDLQSTSKQEKVVIDLIRKGEFEEAIKAYDEMNLTSRYVEQVKQIEHTGAIKDKIEKTQRAMQDDRTALWLSVRNQVNLYRLMDTEESYRKALKLVKDIVASDTTSLLPMTLYLQLAFDQGLHQETVPVLQCYLRQAKTHYDKGRVLANLGIAYSRLLERDLSIRYTQEALDLYEQLAERSKDSTLYLYERMVCCRSLTDSYSRGADTARYIEYGMRYVSMFRRCKVTDRERVSPQYMRFCSSIMRFYERMRDEDGMNKVWDEFLPEAKALYDASPQQYASDYLALWASRMSILNKQKRYDETISVFDELYPTLQTNYKRNPNLWNRSYFRFHRAIASAYSQKEQYNKAIEHHTACIDIIREDVGERSILDTDIAYSLFYRAQDKSRIEKYDEALEDLISARQMVINRQLNKTLSGKQLLVDIQNLEEMLVISY